MPTPRRKCLSALVSVDASAAGPCQGRGARVEAADHHRAHLDPRLSARFMESVQRYGLLCPAELHTTKAHRDGREGLVFDRLQAVAIAGRRERVFVGDSGLRQGVDSGFCDPSLPDPPRRLFEAEGGDETNGA